MLHFQSSALRQLKIVLKDLKIQPVNKLVIKLEQFTQKIQKFIAYINDQFSHLKKLSIEIQDDQNYLYFPLIDKVRECSI